MNCQEVEPFVSALHDGETVSRETAEHIRNCPACRARLEDYARMGVELRLLASNAAEEVPSRLPQLPPLRRGWGRSLTARVLVPRFALGAGLFAILGLSVGLGWMHAQAAGLWFQFNVTSPDRKGSWGDQVQAGYRGKPAVITRVHLSGEPKEQLAAMINVDEVQYGLVRLSIRARRFEVAPEAGPEARPIHESVEVRPTFDEMGRQMLASTTPHQYDYIPGQVLEIPVEGGGKLLLTGHVLERPASFWGKEDYPLEPGTNQIVLAEPALVRDKELLIKGVGSASAEGEGSYVAIFVPNEGLLGFLLKPIEGAVEAEAEYGQARFKIEGHDYVLFSATPITGGQQPREIWVYRDTNYTPGPIGTIGSGSDFLGLIKKAGK
jgi:hypothetical protein